MAECFPERLIFDVTGCMSDQLADTVWLNVLRKKKLTELLIRWLNDLLLELLAELLAIWLADWQTV